MKIPKIDGERNLYDASQKLKELKSSLYYDASRTVVFVNGMRNSGQDHYESAMSLSYLQMCKVQGIYNATEGLLKDLSQCITDKIQLQAQPLGAENLLKMVNKVTKNEAETEKLIITALKVNPATYSLYDYIIKNKSLQSEHPVNHLFLPKDHIWF